MAADGGLDRIEFGDAPQRFCRDRRAGGLLHLIELASGVSPTSCELDSAAVAEPVEAGIPVDLHGAAEPGQVRSGALGFAIRAVKIDRGWRIGPVPGPVVAGVHSQSTGLGAAAAGIEHRDRRIVGEQFLRSEDALGELGLKRLEPPAGTTDPVRERRTVQLDALPAEDLTLPIKRQVIAILGNKDVGEEGWSGKALGDRPFRRGRLMDRPTGSAAIARPTDADDPKLYRDMVEDLACRLADQVQFAAAAGAGLLLDIEPHLFARQVRRQTWPLVLSLRRLGFGGRNRKPGFDARKIGVEIFEAELQLVAIELFCPPAELAALQLLDDEVKPFDLGIRFAQTGTLGCERAHQLLQRLHIVR